MRSRLASLDALRAFGALSIFFLMAVDASAILGADWLCQIATHTTLTHGLFPSTAGSINGVTWTLSLELKLYVAGFFSAHLASKARKAHRLALGFDRVRD